MENDQSPAVDTERRRQHTADCDADDIEGGMCKLPSRHGPDQRVVLRLEVVSSRSLKAIVASLWAALFAGIILLVICATYKQMQVPTAANTHKQQHVLAPLHRTRSCRSCSTQCPCSTPSSHHLLSCSCCLCLYIQ